MRSGVDVANRTLLLLLGLLLLAAGAVGIAYGLGAFGKSRSRQVILTDDLREFATDNWWFWPAVAAGAVLISLLALRWLAAQFVTKRLSDLDLERDRSRGGTRLRGSALTDALAEEVESYRGVEGAQARLVGDPDRPRLVLTVDLDERADLASLRRRIEQQAVANARQAVGHEGLPVELRLRVAAPSGRRLG